MVPLVPKILNSQLCSSQVSSSSFLLPLTYLSEEIPVQSSLLEQSLHLCGAILSSLYSHCPVRQRTSSLFAWAAHLTNTAFRLCPQLYRIWYWVHTRGGGSGAVSFVGERSRSP
ncbi:hypothetical protein N656DRAFT_104246 [Canariomyces notabilis]|uniref:Uncharacterized protein n=1 Tax=Canariomyces notabilis TaxID=2074819 RepID=A0AAN6YRI9_9PEZI|nr:hypothetical protein N656DRAFT_104246 [Canariomyces arenarius]